MDAQTLYHDIKNRLQAMHVHDPSYEARYLIEEILDIKWMDIIAGTQINATAESLDKIETTLKERATGKPLTRILGAREFWGLSFTLNESTLDPRPETEILVEKALAFITNEKICAPDILDLGTGTGCIPITLLHEVKEARATAVDVSARALEAAQDNAKKHGVHERLSCVQSNWLENVKGQFDVIVSNPPYIDTGDIANLTDEVKNHDPILALDGGKNGVAPYEIIFSQIKKALKPTGRAFLEIGQGQCGYIQGIAEKYRIRILNIHPDYAGIPRVVEISCGDK